MGRVKKATKKPAKADADTKGDDVEMVDENNDSQMETEESDPLKSKGCSDKVIEILNKIFEAGQLSIEDLTDEIYTTMNELPESSSTTALNEFTESDFPNVSDKAAHLLSLLKAWKDNPEKTANGKVTVATVKHPNVGPNEEKLKALLEKTKYGHSVTNGQRHYGPPSDFVGEPPGHTTEIFIGKLPRDVFEDELVGVVDEKIGENSIYDLRIMLDPLTGYVRGFGFISFRTREAMQKAVKELNDYEIRPGKQIKVNRSSPNLRLFVGNLPKTKSREEILEEFKNKSDGLTDVIVYGMVDDPKKKNRGFAFLEYDTHQSAASALKKLMRHNVKAFNNEIVVDWAEPQEEPDEETMSKVKILYVKNLKGDLSEEDLKTAFAVHGAVEKIKKVKDYAFVHFDERESAIKAMEALNNTEMGGHTLEISLAKPVSDHAKRLKDQRRGMGRGGMGDFRGGWGGPGMGGRGFRPPAFGARGGFGPRGGFAPRGGGFMGGGMRGGMGGGMMGPYGGGGDMWGWGDTGYYDDGYGGYGMGGMGGGGGFGPPRGAWMGARGGFGMRGMPRGGRMGPRGAPRGRGARGGAGDGGFKRKQFSQGQESKKPKLEASGNTEWGTQPIAQQPIKSEGDAANASANNTAETWHQDSFPTGASW